MKSIVLIGMLFCALCSYAQVVQDSVRVYFRQGQSVVDVSYRDNADRFKLLQERYLLYSRYPQYWLKGIRIVSSASPEATFSFNEWLSKQRTESILDYLKSHTEIDASLLTLQPLGEDWKTLRRIVSETPDVPHREQVLDVLSRHHDGQEGEGDLKRIVGGESYQYLYNKVYPRLRQTNVVFDVVKERTYQYPARPSLGQPMAPPGLLPEAPLYVFEPETEDTRTVLALKTNLLYDAVTAVNVEVEVPIRNHWSVMVEDVFPWWERDNKYCFQLWEMGVEGRYWFRNNRWHSQKLQGHFVGAYTMSGKYDFQWDREVNYQGEFWSVGATYGYVKRISRLFLMEFSASVGFLSSAYRHYYPSDGYEVLLRDKYKFGRTGYFGPTKLKVSLVMPLHIKYKKKGGRL